MRALIGGNNQEAIASLQQALHKFAGGCVLVDTCSLERLPDSVAQHRPDVVIVDFSAQVDLALRAVAESQEAYPVRVLAVGPTSDAKLILNTLNRGVDKYVDVEALERDLSTALRRLRAEPRLTRPQGRVISVMGASGGSGASTLVANIGSVLTQKGKKCFLVDLDLEAGDLAAILGVQATNSIAEFCVNLDKMDESLLNKCLVPCSEAMWLLPAPSNYKNLARVTPRGVRKAINMVRKLGAYVVVDVPSTFRQEQAQALFAADFIVVVLRAEFPSVRQASRVLAYLADLGVPAERVRLIVNRRQSRHGLHDSDIESSLQTRIHMSIPEHVKHMSVAVNRGIPLVVDRPRSPVSHRLLELAASVNGAAESAETAKKKGLL